MNNQQIAGNLRSIANFLNGMRFDPRVPSDIKECLLEKANELYDIEEVLSEEE